MVKISIMAGDPGFTVDVARYTGAIFYWLLNGLCGSFRSMLLEKYNNRNIWTDYIIQILIFAGLIITFW